MSKVLLLAFAGTVFCTISSAQTPQIHKVYVVPVTPQSEPVVSSVKAKIGGTLRYQLGENSNSSDLWIDILCVQTVVGDRVTGRTCAAIYSYHPASLVSPYLYLTTSIHVGPLDSTQTPQDIFENFVDETSESKLTAKRAEALLDIRLSCYAHKDMKDEVALACKGL